MPKLPDTSAVAGFKTQTSVDVLNTIRDNSSNYYKDMVPFANNDTASIREIGNVIMTYPALQNEFLTALINRIGRVIVSSKMYLNPWASFKKGLLEFGETVEEIFVDIAKPFTYNPEVAETEVFKRVIPDVKATFHVMNYQKFYKQTIQNDSLRQAFLSWQGITDLIAKIVDAMYTAANYDEFQTMKYMLAKCILKGYMNPVEIPTVEPNNMSNIVSEVKGISNLLTFGSRKYNMAGVFTYTNKEDQIVIINSRFDAQMDVEVLASAFNMDKAEFMGRRVLIDSFGAIDSERLAELFADDPTYVPFTQEELTALDQIPLLTVDKDWFMIFDNIFQFTEIYNPQGLYWQYIYHVWKTFSFSPYANNVLFTPSTPAITSVTVTPGALTIAKGQTAQLNVVVATTGFAPQAVTWSIDSELSTVNSNGLVTVGADETATTLTVTATSKYDNTKTGTATITIG